MMDTSIDLCVACAEAPPEHPTGAVCSGCLAAELAATAARPAPALWAGETVERYALAAVLARLAA